MRITTIKIIIYCSFLFSLGTAFSQAPQATYQVKPGDTLARIALDNGISPKDLIAWNSPIDPNGIVVGQLLFLTPPPGYIPQNSNSSSTITAIFPPPAFIWPIKGRVLSGFIEGSKGIDIAANIGDPVLASADGFVVYSGNTLRGYGNLIIVKHDNTYLTAYAHNSRLLVREGENVKKGQKISEAGDSDTNLPKLHFEVRVNGRPVNPEPYLNGTVITQTSISPKTTVSMDDYKNKCKELGFKQGTEDFGKCVLQLSK